MVAPAAKPTPTSATAAIAAITIRFIDVILSMEDQATPLIRPHRAGCSSFDPLDDVPAVGALRRIVGGHADAAHLELEADVAEGRDHPASGIHIPPGGLHAEIRH